MSESARAAAGRPESLAAPLSLGPVPPTGVRRYGRQAHKRPARLLSLVMASSSSGTGVSRLFEARNLKDLVSAVIAELSGGVGGVASLRGVVTRDNVSARDVNGYGLLHWAARDHVTALVRFLLEEARADANIRDKWGGAPLHDACGYWGGAPEEIMLLLLHHGADPTVRNDDGESPRDKCDGDGARARFERALSTHRAKLRRAVDDGTGGRLPDVLLDMVLGYVL